MENLAKFETDLWSAADNLRANSKLTSSDYFMPVLGIIFLRHAANRFDAAARQIADDQAAGRMPQRKILPADYIRRRALFLPEAARYDTIMDKASTDPVGLPKLVTDAMTAIEADFEPLANVLPKDYGIFEPKVLEELMRLFNSEQIKRATGDVFGRIYEYFLAKFSIQKAHDNGEFFTPSSLVQLIVNVIEPDHGSVFDPACGSGGMFVQSSHFIEQEGGDTTKKVVFYGQEKNRDTIRIAKMNLAVHGLEGKIAEAITYYQDEHNLAPTKALAPGSCDFVMANPPFNVDLVDAGRIKSDPRLPFGLPGVNKDKRVSNGNYLWISYFYSYLSEKGRAGFVMSSQASSAGNDEKAVRQKLVETGAVDVMISIKGGFFYTRTVPCELWFLDKNKPSAPSPLAPLPEGEGNENAQGCVREGEGNKNTHYRGGYDFEGLIERARELRQKQTPAEEVLWELVRDRRCLDLKFRRQHQFGDYILDFYCAEQKLAIELDGPIHESQAKRDHKRDAFLTAQGVKVLRIPNQVLLNDTAATLSSIAAQISPASQSPLPRPLGEGRGEGDVALNHKGNVLMLDARTIGQLMKGSRKVYEFTPEQMRNLTAIVWLYRGETGRFRELRRHYEDEWSACRRVIDVFFDSCGDANPICNFRSAVKWAYNHLSDPSEMDGFMAKVYPLKDLGNSFLKAGRALRQLNQSRNHNLHETARLFTSDAKPVIHELQALLKSSNELADRIRPRVEKRERPKLDEAAAAMRATADEVLASLTGAAYWARQCEWLYHRFPDNVYRDVPGLCRVVTRAEIEAADWSLTPGRYVGVAPVEVDEDFDFELTITEIHTELAGLNVEAAELAATIQRNLEELGV